MSIFDYSGRVVRVRSESKDKAPAVFSLKANGTQINVGIATGLSLQESVAMQATPSLQRVLHIIAFGDAPGQLSIDVITSLLSCGTDDKALSLDALVERYNTYRLGPQRQEKLTVTVGNQTWDAYLISQSIQAVASASGLAQGKLQFIIARNTKT